jgi:hypothetical protein
MVRKISITLHDDGKATVEGEINHCYPTYERGIEVLQLMVLSLSPKLEVPLTPEIAERIGAIIKKHENKLPEDTEVELSCGSLELPPCPKKTRIKQPQVRAKMPHNSRKGIPNWESEETLIIKTAIDREQAWVVYQELCPGKRNANAVKQKWSKLHPKNDGVASTINVKQSAKAIDSSNDVKEPEKEVVDKPFPASPKETRKATSAYQPETLAERFPLKTHVRQVKEYLGRKVTGIGSVTDHVKGLVEVNFNGSQYYKIAPDCLEVV